MDKNNLVVLSLFDGMGGGRIALDKLGIIPKKYFASEIKPCAIKCATANYDDIIEIGDVTKVKYENNKLYNADGDVVYEGYIDLLLFGSPCQDFSIANLQNKAKENNNFASYGLNGLKSKLFYEALRIKNECKPTYFLFENVKMKESSERLLNHYCGVKGLHINSNLVSYQDRNRIYWTNIPNVTIPQDRHIDFQDYINMGDLEEAKCNPTSSRLRMWNNGKGKENGLLNCDNITYAHKVHCLTRKQDRSPNSGLIAYKDFCRYLTRRELEQAQTVPLGYTDCVSYLQAQDLLGDGWTIDVIAHILSFM